MRDIAPVIFIFVVETDRRSKAFLLHIQPDFADTIRRQFALAPFVVDAQFEVIKGYLAHHRVQHILDLAGQHGFAPRRVFLALQQRSKRQHLTKHARGFRQRQRRVAFQMPLLRRQHLMHPVPEFMSECHHIARPPHIVEQQIGMRGRHGRMGEGARRFAGTGLRINPAIVEKAPADSGKVGRKFSIGRQHDVPRLTPAVKRVARIGQRRVAVPVIHHPLAKPFRLQPIIAVRQIGIRVLHRRRQGLDDLILHLIAEIAGRLRRRVAPPAILDLLVLGERIGDQREKLDVFAQPLSDSPGARLANLAVGIRQHVERLLDGLFRAADPEPHPGHGFVEQPVPGGPPGDLLVM